MGICFNKFCFSESYPDASNHRATLIFLHGLGDSGYNWVHTLSKTINNPHLKYLCPNAPIMKVRINADARLRSWFNIFSLNVNGPEDEEGIKNAARYIHSLIEKEEELGIPSSRIVLGGFSQGGALALYSAFTFVKPLAGIVILSAWLPLHHEFFENIRGNISTPIFQGHGTRDPLVVLPWARKTAEMVKLINRRHTLRLYDGLGHGVNNEELDDVARFINMVLPIINEQRSARDNEKKCDSSENNIQINESVNVMLTQNITDLENSLPGCSSWCDNSEEPKRYVNDNNLSSNEEKITNDKVVINSDVALSDHILDKLLQSQMQLESLKKEYDQVVARLETKSEKVEDLTQSLERIQKTNDSLKERLRTVQPEISEHRDSENMRELHERLENSVVQLEFLKAENQGLKNKISQLEELLQQQQQSSIFNRNYQQEFEKLKQLFNGETSSQKFFKTELSSLMANLDSIKNRLLDLDKSHPRFCHQCQSHSTFFEFHPQCSFKTGVQKLLNDVQQAIFQVKNSFPK